MAPPKITYEANPFFTLFGVFLMNKDIVMERIKRMHKKFNENMEKLGYDESSLEEFLDWLEDQVQG